MPTIRQIKKVGGSLSLLIPHDIAEITGIIEGTSVQLSIVGRQIVVEPKDDTIPDATFQRSLAAVLRRHGPALKMLADHDAGKIDLGKRK